jgi:lipid II:glycine glycyltransferase (peptidoglycan interpeptide bridge formation enzyme)
MVLREESSQEKWDAWASPAPHATFLQSWAWGEGQKALGKRVSRFVIEDNGEALFLAQAIEEKRKFLTYWFVPGGPVGVGKYRVSSIEYRVWEQVTELLKKRLLRGSAVFLRIEPLIECGSDVSHSTIHDSCAWIPTASFSPAVHWMVDLRGKTEEWLLLEMEQKTRYNVRLGQKNKVTTRLSTEGKDFAVFLQLMKETGIRNNITTHTDRYLSNTFFAMAELGMATLRIAEYEGKILAGSIEVSFGDTVTYLHGASSTALRETKAPNVLQWEAMRDALRNGYGWYDFGGCNPVDASNHLYKKSLEGVTRFNEIIILAFT